MSKTAEMRACCSAEISLRGTEKLMRATRDSMMLGILLAVAVDAGRGVRSAVVLFQVCTIRIADKVPGQRNTAVVSLVLTARDAASDSVGAQPGTSEACEGVGLFAAAAIHEGRR